MDELLPDTVSVAEVFGDPPAPALHPWEEAIVGDSVAKRRREFAIGRGCARKALSRLGSPPAPLLSGSRGEPLWPAGVVGAITHCDGYCAAVVARRHDIVGVGVDAEPAKPLPAGILEAVSLPEERARLPRPAGRAQRAPWDRLLFSAKESVYKVWFPLTGRSLEFEEASVTFHPEGDGPAEHGAAEGASDSRGTGSGRGTGTGSGRGTGKEAGEPPAGGTFSVRILATPWRLGDRTLSALTGRFLVRDGVLLTCIAVPAAGRALPGRRAAFYQSAPARAQSALWESS
ncbi:4'-phosphopantetheinyl transferase superfamily protein [Streptomyces sp. NPDC051776]|uniref:4'-phosphopantetheinyl transferase family protein n=1 Tax=Streptomyces sp. NPDC051776 TaxID=3155414 RepID=UPI00344286A4